MQLLCRAAVVDRHCVASAGQVTRHGIAHDAQANKGHMLRRSGFVGFCVQAAHDCLWCEVGEWIKLAIVHQIVVLGGTCLKVAKCRLKFDPTENGAGGFGPAFACQRRVPFEGLNKVDLACPRG